MNSRLLKIMIFCMMIPLVASCTPQAESTPEVDKAATRAVELAIMMQTQTAAAIPPTLPPTNTPEPTPTETLSPTPVEVRLPKVINGPAPCYLKPDTTADLRSNISDGKDLEFLAIGSLPGWYKVENPYFYTPCWIDGKYLDIDNNMDMSVFPVE